MTISTKSANCSARRAGMKSIRRARLVMTSLLEDEQIYHMQKDHSLELLRMVIRMLRKAERQIERYHGPE